MSPKSTCSTGRTLPELVAPSVLRLVAVIAVVGLVAVIVVVGLVAVVVVVGLVVEFVTEYTRGR